VGGHDRLLWGTEFYVGLLPMAGAESSLHNVR